MDNEHIATYLNDHLAGSVVALELLEHLEAAHDNTPLAEFFFRSPQPASQTKPLPTSPSDLKSVGETKRVRRIVMLAHLSRQVYIGHSCKTTFVSVRAYIRSTSQTKIMTPSLLRYIP